MATMATMAKKLTRLSVPNRVSFEVTSLCQANCVFCEQPKRRTSAKLLKSRDLNTDEALDVLRNCRTFGVRSIFLTGGEPLMREDLEDLVDFCVNTGMDPIVSTNGILLTEERAAALYEVGLRSIQIGLHGDSPITHDVITKVPGGFAKTLEGLTNAAERFGRIDVNCVAIKSNFRRIPALYDMLVKMGVEGALQVLRPMCSSEHMLAETMTPEEYEELESNLLPLEKKGFKIDSIGHLPGAPKLSEFEKKQLVPHFGMIPHPDMTCYGCKTMIAILSDGTAVPCVTLRAVSLGNLLNEPLEKIWNGDVAKQVSELTPDKYQGVCGTCEKKWTCYSCRGVAFALTNNVYGDDISCEKLNPHRKHNAPKLSAADDLPPKK